MTTALDLARRTIAVVDSLYFASLGKLALPERLDFSGLQHNIEEKLNALLTRGKPRDYFDVYFLLRKGMITVEQKPRLAEVKQRLLASRVNFQRELATFLLWSHHALLKNFRQTLEDELERHDV